MEACFANYLIRVKDLITSEASNKVLNACVQVLILSVELSGHINLLRYSIKSHRLCQCRKREIAFKMPSCIIIKYVLKLKHI